MTETVAGEPPNESKKRPVEPIGQRSLMRLFISATLASSLLPLNSTMIAVALPEIGLEFGAKPADLTQALVVVYLLAGIVAQSPAGKFGDIWGHTRTLALGRWLFAGAAVLGVVSPYLFGLSVSRILMAVGGALMIPATMALLRIHISVERRSRLFGYFGAAMASSAALGPLIGGVLTEHFGWASVFLANIPILALSIVLQPRGLADTAAKGEGRAGDTTANLRHFDWLGSVLLGVGLVALVTVARTPGSAALILGALGVVSIGWFIFWELRVPVPIVDLMLFRRLTFTAGAIMIALQNVAMYATLFQMPFYLAVLIDAGPSEIGIVLWAMSGGMVLFAPVGGMLSERLGVRRTVAGGAAISIIGIALLVVTFGTPSLVIVTSCVLVFGCGFGLSHGPIQAAALSAIPPQHSGMASGVIATLRYIGGVIGIAALGLLLASDPGGADLTIHRDAFMLYVGSLILTLFLALAMPRFLRDVEAK